MTAATDELWTRLMPIVGPLPAEQRVAAMAYVLEATSGKDIDDALIRDLTMGFGDVGGQLQ
jgi:hypothetical protein